MSIQTKDSWIKVSSDTIAELVIDEITEEDKYVGIDLNSNLITEEVYEYIEKQQIVNKFEIDRYQNVNDKAFFKSAFKMNIEKITDRNNKFKVDITRKHRQDRDVNILVVFN